MAALSMAANISENNGRRTKAKLAMTRETWRRRHDGGWRIARGRIRRK